MNIVILKELGSVGVIINCKPFVSGERITVPIVGAVGGTLTVGARSYSVNEYGEVVLPEYELAHGENKVSYNDGNESFECGRLVRNGRFLNVSNDVDSLIVACAVKLAAQAAELELLKNELETIKGQYGISIV